MTTMAGPRYLRKCQPVPVMVKRSKVVEGEVFVAKEGGERRRVGVVWCWKRR